MQYNASLLCTIYIARRNAQAMVSGICPRGSQGGDASFVSLSLEAACCEESETTDSASLQDHYHGVDAWGMANKTLLHGLPVAESWRHASDIFSALGPFVLLSATLCLLVTSVMFVAREGAWLPIPVRGVDGDSGVACTRSRIFSYPLACTHFGSAIGLRTILSRIDCESRGGYANLRL